MNENRTSSPGLKYHIAVVSVMVFFGMLLLALVDIRRGFLFADYFKIGSPSVLLNLNLAHLLLLFVGVLGVWLTYRYLTKAEKDLKSQGIRLDSFVKVMAIVIGALLVVDLFTYRGVPASRTMAAGNMSVGTGPMGLGRAIAVASLPDWLQPFAEGINYMLIVWHATTLGILLGGLFLTAGSAMAIKLSRPGFGTHVAGAATAMAQPFCSCCAAPVGAALYRRGASLGPVLAFTVSAPMLNITSLVLAAALLPAKYALLRIAGGIIVAVLATYLVSLIGSRWVQQDGTGVRHGQVFAWTSNLLTAYSRLFHFEKFLVDRGADSPSVFIKNWLSTAGRLARVVVPLFAVFSVLAAYAVKAMPASGNNLLGVGVTSFFATVLMAPTWTEIPLAAKLINEGLTGMAATLLITLPAVSLPCLAIIGGAVRSLKIAALLGLVVFAAGILAGVIFLNV
ncbi:MAG: permease [Chloroflexi bacterium]|nr:permease [Chloroflexota bacterium]